MLAPVKLQCTLLLCLTVAAATACKQTTEGAQAPAPANAPTAAAAALSNANTAALARGAQLYTNICAVCHGAAGEGYKADQAPALAQPDFLASVSDVFLRAAIRDGRKGSTMSAWAIEHGGPLSAADIELLISFIRNWQKKPMATLDESALMGDHNRGELIYQRECVRCHGAHGTEGPNIRLGNAALLASASNGFLRMAIRGGRAGTAMPRFDATLGKQGIEDVIAVLRKFQTDAAYAAAAAPPPTAAAAAAAAAPTPTAPLPLGPVPLNPSGPEPEGFHKYPPGTTPADLIHAQLVRGARMAILDARAPSDYMNQHITGAVSVPYYDPSPYLTKLPKNTWLVAYCACPHAESGELAGKLVAAGFSKVTVLDEGLGVWTSKHYGTHTGPKP